jgi:hypothetical protein
MTREPDAITHTFDSSSPMTFGSYLGGSIKGPGNSNVYLNFLADNSESYFNKIQFSSSSNSFESDNHAFIAAAQDVPEPTEPSSVLGLLTIGALGVGSALKSSKSINQAKLEILRVAEKVFECIQCSQAIQKFLIDRGISGKRIKLYTGSLKKLSFREEYRMELYELIRKIKKRPAFYLGQKSLSHLQVFLDGYTFARRQSGIPISAQEQEFEKFQEWIEQRFQQPNTQSWTKIILFHSEDEAQALDLFFELFDEFLKEQEGTAETAILRYSTNHLYTIKVRTKVVTSQKQVSQSQV